MFRIHPTAQIHPTARINVDEGYIGPNAVIRENVIIEGRRVEIGRFAFFARGAWIGGGSCRNPLSVLTAGDFLHMGANAHVNTACPVTLGHEVGLGIDTKLFTHGAWLSAWDGFPADWGAVAVGDRVWFPNAWINPGVTLGSDIVVGARSLVAESLPSGCYATGSPAKPVHLNIFPQKVSPRRRLALFTRIVNEAEAICGQNRSWRQTAPEVFAFDGGTVFNVGARAITGLADAYTETLKEQLRRNGIRFRYEAADGEYQPWSAWDR